MRKPVASTQKANDSSVERSYEVGYRKPPEAGQFKKGQSGNPTGRPKGKFSPNNSSAVPKDFALSYLLEEAYRVVKLRDGDKVVKMPAIQAIIRAKVLSALKGNRLAQNFITTMVQKAEQDRKAEFFDNFKTAIEYKRDAELEFLRCDSLGIPRTEIYPHPDDVIIDPRTGICEFDGPFNAEEAQMLENARAELDYLQQSIAKNSVLAKKGRSKAIHGEILALQQRSFEELNSMMPGRYKWMPKLEK